MIRCGNMRIYSLEDDYCVGEGGCLVWMSRRMTSVEEQGDD